MSYVMAQLAENYQVGIGVSSGVIIAIYISLSIILILRMYKLRGKIMISSVIPVVHLVLFFFGNRVSKKNKKMSDRNSKTSTDVENTQSGNGDLKDNDFIDGMFD